MQQINKTSLRIKPYSVKELAGLYGICSRTFKKWLEPFEPAIGPRNGRYYTIHQVNIIFDKLGTPEKE
jgi:hypothetical protein